MMTLPHPLPYMHVDCLSRVCWMMSWGMLFPHMLPGWETHRRLRIPAEGSHFLHVGHVVQQGKLDLKDLLSYLPRGRVIWDNNLPRGSLTAAMFSQMQQKVWTHWTWTFRTEKRKSSFLEESVSTQRPALCRDRSHCGPGATEQTTKVCLHHHSPGTVSLAGWSFPCSGKSHSPGQI